MQNEESQNGSQNIRNPIVVMRFKASKPGDVQICRLEHFLGPEMILFAKYSGIGASSKSDSAHKRYGGEENIKFCAVRI